VGYVSASVLLAPRLGATAFIMLVIAGQILASLMFDHYGLMGYVVRPFNEWRLVGGILMVVSVFLITTH